MQVHFWSKKGSRKRSILAAKIYDSDDSSAWCVSKNQGINEYIFLPYYPNEGSENAYSGLYKRENYLDLFIVNGFAKSKELFQANNRVKKIRVELVEIGYDYTSNSDAMFGDIVLSAGPILNSKNDILIEDTMETQKISIKIFPKILDRQFLNMSFLVKIIILEVYPGAKYKDTCISEASIGFVYDEKPAR